MCVRCVTRRARSLRVDAAGPPVAQEQAAKERAANPKQTDACAAPAPDSRGATPGTTSCPPLSASEFATGLVVLAGVVFGTTLAVPWLIFFESPLCLIILLAAVYQAFRMNAPVRPWRHDPYRLSPT